MNVIIRCATAADLETLIPLLDEEFIFSKGRRISISQRFPSVYCSDNLDNIIVAVDKDGILSSLAIKHFFWKNQDRYFSAGMLGAVYTRPHRRKQGLASKLLSAAIDKLNQDEVDFAVLWSTQPSFYASLGWFVADCGVLGEMTEIQNVYTPSDIIVTSSSDVLNLQKIERIRQECFTPKVSRKTSDYLQVPLPVESIDLLLSDQIESMGYALVGRSKNISVLYEMMGHQKSFPSLWQQIASRHQPILINDHPGSDSYHWLSNNGVSWKPKSLAIWRNLSTKVNMEMLSDWHIPYFDRI